MAIFLKTQRTQIELIDRRHALRLHRYYTENQSHLAPWEPLRPLDYHCLRAWKKRIKRFKSQYAEGSALRVVALVPGTGDVIGVCSCTNIVKGVFQSCDVGYSVSKDFAGQGFMTEILGCTVDYMFREFDLHRVAASYVPENSRSARVLEKCGFEKEGYARSYLKIAGRWRDHVVTAKINPGHEA